MAADLRETWKTSLLRHRSDAVHRCTIDLGGLMGQPVQPANLTDPTAPGPGTDGGTGFLGLPMALLVHALTMGNPRFQVPEPLPYALLAALGISLLWRVGAPPWVSALRFSRPS